MWEKQKQKQIQKNINIGIYSDTITVINVKLCMMALLIKFSYHSSLPDRISRAEECQTL